MARDGLGMTLVQEPRINRNHKCSIFNNLVSDVQISASRQCIDRRTTGKPMISTNIARESLRDSAFDVYSLVELVNKDLFLIISPALSRGTHTFDTALELWHLRDYHTSSD